MNWWTILSVGCGLATLAVLFLFVIPAFKQGTRLARAPGGAIVAPSPADKIPKASRALLQLLQAAVASGLDSARHVGLPIIPSLYVEKGSDRQLTRFAMGTQDWGLNTARQQAQAATGADRVAIWYYAGVKLQPSDLEQEAIVVECHERGMPQGVAFAQLITGVGSRITPSGSPKPFATCSPFLGT